LVHAVVMGVAKVLVELVMGAAKLLVDEV